MELYLLKVLKRNFFILFLILMPLVMGCAVKQKIDFSYSPQDSKDVDNIGNGKLIAVIPALDSRPGKITPDWVGIIRGGYMNVFYVKTKSGKPFAEKVTQAMSTELERWGFTSIKTKDTNNLSDSNFISKQINGAKSDRAIVIDIKFWKSDVMVVSTIFEFDFLIIIYNQEGKQMFSKSFNDKRNVGGSFWNSPGHMKKSIPKVFREVIISIFNDSEIQAALLN